MGIIYPLVVLVVASVVGVGIVATGVYLGLRVYDAFSGSRVFGTE